MSDKVCGDFGGRTKGGEPCQQPRVDGMCAHHRADAESNEHQRQKKARQDAFLSAYSQTGNITVAARKAGVDRSTHYDWIDTTDGYAARFAEAGEEAADMLEAEARRRAVVGVEEPVGWYQGEAGGTVRKYSDTLLIFLLKGIRPERYRERHSLEHSGAIEGGVQQVHVYLPDNKRDELPDAVRNRLAATNGGG